MKTFILALAALAAFPALASVIDDFETSVRGWGGWCDAESVKPSFRRSDDAAGGAYSLEFTFPGSVQYSGVTRNGVTIPEEAETLELWVKLVDGAMPGTLLLETAAPSGEPRDVFKAALPAPAPGAWKLVSVPLEKFTYAYTKGSKPDREKPSRPDRARKFDLILIGYRQSPGTFRLDELRFGAAKEKKEEIPQESGVNLLPGDNSFETGPGNWIYYYAKQDLDIFRGDGAFGENCMELKGGEEKFSWICNYLMQDVLRSGDDYVLSFHAKAAPGKKLAVSLINLNWEFLVSREFELTPEWKRYTLRLPAVKRAEKSYFMFDVPNDSGGNVRIDALQLERGSEPTPYRASNPTELFATVNRSGEIVAEGETPQLELRLLNTRQTELETGITVEFPGREPLLRKATLPPGKPHAITVSCDFARHPGYYPAVVIVRDRNGEMLARQDAPFVVTPRTGASDEFFGISVNHVPQEARTRTGSTWTRGNAPAWRATEARQGRFPEAYGRAMPQEKTLFTIIDMTKAPGWVKKEKGLVADPESAREFARWIARNVGPVAGAFELQNEPDLTMTGGTGVSREEAARNLAGLFRVFRQEIGKSGKPLLLNVSGEGMPFAREVFKHAADSIDGIASHPYTFPRYLGPQAGYCSSPEAGNVLGQLKEAQELIRQYGGGKELWIGELGWGLDHAAPPDSVWARRHAAFLARTFLLARTVPELKRIIWFTGLGALEGGRYEYGVWRNANGVRPLPAVAAFANLAAIMADAREIEFPLDGEVKAVGWKNGEREYLAVWRPEADGEAAPVSPGGATVLDLCGNLHQGEFTPGEEPYYIEIASPEMKRDLLAALERQKPLTIHGFAADDRTLALSVRNNLSRQWDGKIQGVELSLAPRERREVRIPLPESLPASGTTVALSAESGGELLRAQIVVPPMLDVKPLGSVDWKTVPFEKLEPQIVLCERNQIFPPDPFINWTGPEDLSARLFLSWDEQNFYLIAEVTDDKHEQPWKDGEIWRGDSMQFAFDAANDARPRSGYDNNDYEYGAAFERKLWRWQAAAGKPAGEAEKLEGIITRDGDKTLYRIRIPWSELSPLSPRPGAIAGFNAVFHDRDNGVTNYFAAAAPGLSPFKNPALFLKIRLVK